MAKIKSNKKEEKTNVLDEIAGNDDWLKNFVGDEDEE